MTGPPDRESHLTAGLPSSGRLDSWNGTAAYLKRDVQTVQRWELNEGLPIRRHRHSTGAVMFGYMAELGAWLDNRQPEAEPREPAGEREARERAEAPPGRRGAS